MAYSLLVGSSLAFGSSVSIRELERHPHSCVSHCHSAPHRFPELRKHSSSLICCLKSKVHEDITALKKYRRAGEVWQSSKTASPESDRDPSIWRFQFWRTRQHNDVCSCSRNTETESNKKGLMGKAELSIGVIAALSLLKFYKSEISPYIPGSCRYVPTCSEYAMQAYKTYGFCKGTVLTLWRIMRCNPWGRSGFDPPRWFDGS